MEYHRAGVPALCHKFCYRLSASLSHSADTASDGIRQSPRGESVTVPTFGPSGRQERLNCCVKKRRIKVVSHFLMVASSYTPAKVLCAARKILRGG